VTAQRENLQRSMPFELRDGGTDGLTLDGLAATFDQPTLIDSWEGTFYEQIRKGAFRKTIRENTPVMQFDHGRHPLIGSIPIGTITDLRETDQGLEVSGRLTDNWLMQPVRDAIAEKSIKGMSFRFNVVREEWRDAGGKLVRPDELEQLLWMPGDRGPLTRTLIEVRCAELGPVVFPAYDTTSVGVRARSLAETITEDDEMRREVRHSLARHADIRGDLEDPELRHQVARALLFDPPDAPLEREHPSEEQERTADAPATEGHPSEEEESDAPPPDGHPSPTPRTAQLREQIGEITELMRERLASIEGK
jgi:HK97 family phage prohead protease